MKFSTLPTANQSFIIEEIAQRVMAGSVFAWHERGVGTDAVGRRLAVEQLAREDFDFIYQHFSSVLNRRPIDMHSDIENNLTPVVIEMVGGMLAKYDAAPCSYTFADFLPVMGVAA